MNDSSEPGMMNDAIRIIEQFGGIRPMAAKMSVPVTTVQGWKKRGVIPGNRRDDVIHAARAHGIDMTGLVALSEAANHNENTGERGFAQAMDEAAETDNVRDDDFIRAEKGAPPDPSVSYTPPCAPERDNDDMMREIAAAAGRRAVAKSVTASLLLLLVACGLGLMLFWPANQQAQSLSARLTALEGRSVALEKQIGSAAMPAASGDFVAKMTALEDRVGKLEAAVAQISANPTAAPDPAVAQRLDAVEAKLAGNAASAGANGIDALFDHLKQWQQTPEGRQMLAGSARDLGTMIESHQGNVDEALTAAQAQSDTLGQALKTVSASDLKPAALLLALAQLRTSMGTSAPFDEDLKLVRQLMGDSGDEALKGSMETLAPVAAKGVLTPAALGDQLRDMADAIVTASLKDQNVTIKDKAIARLGELVQIRKGGELINGTDIQSHIVRAENNMDEGDVAAALHELQSLTGPAADAAKPLVDATSSTLLAQQVEASIATHIAAATENALPSIAGTTPVAKRLDELKTPPAAPKPAAVAPVPAAQPASAP